MQWLAVESDIYREFADVIHHPQAQLQPATSSMRVRSRFEWRSFRNRKFSAVLWV
jgi:hypothetical protein